MQSTRASKCDQRVVARIVAALNGNYADGFLHDGVGHVHNSLRKLRSGSHGAAGTLHPLLSARQIQREIAGEESPLGDPSQNQMRVSDRGPLAAPVTDGAGIS